MSLIIKDGEGNITNMDSVLENSIHTPVHTVKTDLTYIYMCGGFIDFDVLTKYIYIKAPTSTDPYTQITFTYTGTNMVKCSIFENPVVSVDGTQIVLNRLNRYLSQDTNVLLYTEPTVDSEGTLVTSYCQDLDIILANDLTYIIKLEALNINDMIQWQVVSREAA